MLAVLAIAAPVFVVIGLGYLTARRGWIDAAGFRGLNTFVFGVATPALLFASGTAGHGGSTRAALAFFAAAFLLYGAVLLAGARAGWPLARSGPMALDVTFGNTVMMGIPIVFAAFGQEGLAILMLILGLHALLLLTTGTIIAEIAAQTGARPWAMARAAAGGVARNPIVVAVFAALAVSLLGLPVPPVLRASLEMLGAAAPAAALFALGASLTGFNLAAAWAQTGTTLALKLAALPLLVWLLGWAAGLSPLEHAVATVTAALPTGANAFMLASRYRVGMAESGAAVLASTALSLLTVPLVLWFVR
jgi:malonate transporter and related proteins